MTSASPMKLTADEIKARLRVVCICKGIKMAKICDAILTKNCETVEQVNKATGSGSGGCNATRCRPVIEQILQNGGRPLDLRKVSELQDEAQEQLDAQGIVLNDPQD